MKNKTTVTLAYLIGRMVAYLEFKNLLRKAGLFLITSGSL